LGLIFITARLISVQHQMMRVFALLFLFLQSLLQANALAIGTTPTPTNVGAQLNAAYGGLKSRFGLAHQGRYPKFIHIAFCIEATTSIDQSEPKRSLLLCYNTSAARAEFMGRSHWSAATTADEDASERPLTYVRNGIIA
jgi:hypothetical protein